MNDDQGWVTAIMTGGIALIVLRAELAARKDDAARRKAQRAPTIADDTIEFVRMAEATGSAIE